jgi:regulator of sirC expression with transglutaminase-like and TPR domain
VDPSARFVGLVRGAAGAVRLDEGALLIASHVRPALRLEDELARLDRLAAAVPAPTLDSLLRHLFASGRFGPNRADYDDPDNSFLDQVLARGVGIPITLSVLAIEVGRRIGVPLAPVGMPGHFLVRDESVPSRFVDPFNGARVIDADGCRRLFHAVAGPHAPWDTAFLVPVEGVAVLARILANLKRTYAARRDLANLAWVMRLRTQLPGPHADPVEEWSKLMAPLN